MVRLLAIALTSGLLASLPPRPGVKVQPPCQPIRGGVWSRLAYPLPNALYSQNQELEVPSPDGHYRLVVRRNAASIRHHKRFIQFRGLYVAPAPRLQIVSDGQPLKVILPKWFDKLSQADRSFLDPRNVLNDGVEFLWAPDSRSLAVTENFSQTNGFPDTPHAGNWRVLIYRIRRSQVYPFFIDRKAGEAYQKTNACGMWPDVAALKWVGSGEILLLTQAWSTPVYQQCKNPDWLQKQADLGYLVAVPSGHILRTYTQQELAKWQNILGPAVNPDDGPKGQPYLEGHC